MLKTPKGSSLKIYIDSSEYLTIIKVKIGHITGCCTKFYFKTESRTIVLHTDTIPLIQTIINLLRINSLDYVNNIFGEPFVIFNYSCSHK